eukprot:684539_1
MRLGCLHRSIYQTIHVSSANLQKRFITSQAVRTLIYCTKHLHHTSQAFYSRHSFSSPSVWNSFNPHRTMPTRDWQSLLCDEASIVPITKINSIPARIPTNDHSIYQTIHPSSQYRYLIFQYLTHKKIDSHIRNIKCFTPQYHNPRPTKQLSSAVSCGACLGACLLVSGACLLDVMEKYMKRTIARPLLAVIMASIPVAIAKIMNLDPSCLSITCTRQRLPQDFAFKFTPYYLFVVRKKK